jgi:hypothetical protein
MTHPAGFARQAGARAKAAVAGNFATFIVYRRRHGKAMRMLETVS